jgi:phosphonate ABC transporter permease subunit PhnE
MVLTYIIIGVLLGVATLLARGSARRLVVAGAVGLIVVFALQPFVQLVGAFTRHEVAPTPIGLTTIFPLLWMAPILAVAVLVLSRGSQARPVAIAGLMTGLAAFVVAWMFSTSPQQVVRIGNLPWVLETLIPLSVLALAFALSRGFKENQWQLVTLGVGVVVAAGLGWFLFSPVSETTFDAMRGYYKMALSPSDTDLETVVKDWQAELQLNNTERDRINQEWLAAQKALVDAQADLNVQQAGLENARANGPDAVAFAQKAVQRAQDAIRDANVKIMQDTIAARAYGLTAPDANLAPLDPITDVSALPPGFKLGRDASEQNLRRVFPERARYGFGAWLLFGTLMTLGGIGLLWRREDALEEGDQIGGVVMAAVIALLAFGFNAVEFDLGRFVRGWPFIADFLDRATPPDWNGILSDVLKAMTITVATAMIGTTLAALLALPTSLLAARNLTQRSAIGRGLYVFMRMFFNIDRGVDTLILALIFVAAVGLGPLAGVLAMAIHSMADLGKLYSEAIENADKGPIEALEASGAPGTSVIRWAVLPQVLPLFVSYTLYRFEINFRVSIILGFVGAGGVGFLIQETMRSGKYDQMVVAVLAVVIMVNVLDFISASVRRRIIG